jgi:hypothetical protein
LLSLSTISDKYAIISMYSVSIENIFPNGEPVRNARKRLCAYRQMVFWCWPGIKRKERRPLPACLVALIRQKFPPTDDEEEFADFVWKDFSYDPAEDGTSKSGLFVVN